MSNATTPAFDPFKAFTQDDLIARIGMTLAQTSELLATYSVTADICYAADSSLEEFQVPTAEALNSQFGMTSSTTFDGRQPKSVGARAAAYNSRCQHGQFPAP
jgi:hypothetical protein